MSRASLAACIEVIRAGYVPIRERSDLRPDLVRRYPAEGWPAVSVLLPDGSPLFLPPRGEEKEPQRVTSGFRASADMAALLRAAFTYYRQAPRDAVTLAQERTDAIAKSAVPTTAAVTEPLVFSLARELRTTFDPERRYFGGAPRLPRFELLEFMFLAGTENDEFRVVGSAALDTLSARLADPADGGMRRAAEGLDWENPQPEKLLDRNARYLELTALALS